MTQVKPAGPDYFSWEPPTYESPTVVQLLPALTPTLSPTSDADHASADSADPSPVLSRKKEGKAKHHKHKERRAGFTSQ